MKNIYILIIAFFISSCQSLTMIDGAQTSKLIPVESTDEFEVFRYEAIANVSYPLDSESGESVRMAWLGRWLSDAGYGDRKYEITSRRAFPRSTLMESHDVYYTIKVFK